MRPSHLLAALCLSTVGSLGCSDSGASGGGSASASATSNAVTPKPTTAASTTATATASAAPRSDCPKDSAGPGTIDAPCEGKGPSRMMEVKWTGKTDDKGPYFSVTNKSPKPILYGKIYVYFYDKAGKQLEVKDPADAAAKPKPFLICSGANLFAGVAKVDEKFTLTFSCVRKADVPEGTAAIEGEMMMVGFADASEKQNEYYWRNKDIGADVRPKGGIK